MEQQLDLKQKMYFVLLRHLNNKQHGIQSVHALAEYAQAFFTTAQYQRWAQVDKTVVFLDGGSSIDMKIQMDFLIDSQLVDFAFFKEEDVFNGITCYCFLADERIWDRKKYPDSLPPLDNSSGIVLAVHRTFDLDAFKERIGGEKNFQFMKFFIYIQVFKITMDIKFDFNDILIVPKEQTNIRSRYKDIDPYYSDMGRGKHLPLITAPMDTVVNHHNAHLFQLEGISVALPRTVNQGRLFSTFSSYGLNDKPRLTEFDNFILLDIANGHMTAVLDWCSEVKKIYPHVQIMAGNIANPNTFEIYIDSGVIDYARVGIGNGNGCLTTRQTGVGYPMGSLVRECYEIKQKNRGYSHVKIVADGGMKNYDDIIKALALGADYVMVGSLLSKTLESAAPTTWKGIKINSDIASFLYKKGFNLKKEFRGMSTKAAQKALGNNVLKTSEGVTRMYDVEYTVAQWSENFKSYLLSAMSYCNASNLSNFIGKADTALISQNAFNRFNK